MRTIALYSPSKTFNLAGLVGSYSITYNDRLRHPLHREGSRTYYNHMNVLSMHALIGAYSEEGKRWLTELQQVLSENAAFACDYIQAHFEGVAVTRPQGTYMLFPDLTEWCARHGKTLDEVEKACWDVGVALQDGRMFHGNCHLRINLASPLSRVQEAFDRLDQYVINAL
jgi:cystathionine beta-lyase